MDEGSWNALDPGHPQFGLRQLLKTIGADREDVKDWIKVETNPARETLLSETLRPAPTTDAWRDLAEQGGGEIKKGLQNLALIEAGDSAQEGLTIALALREALETEGRTAALVTPDRNLARRVATEMKRWNVAIDDSAGRPLAHTAAGTFLCLLAEAAQARFAPVPLLALLKHPFARRGQDSAGFRARARELDRWCLRGPRPDPGLAGITRTIAKAGEERAPPAGLAQLAHWWDEIAKILAPLEHIFAQPEVLLETLLEAQLDAAEALACDEHGICILWAAEDGEASFALTAELKLAADGLDAIETGSWSALFRSLAMKAPVRAQRGQHPRLAILGPLEARLQRFDLIILGGLNEGSWPQGAQSDPWFSRPMRASLGLEQPERGIGRWPRMIFAMLAAWALCVVEPQPCEAEGVPTIASRWLQRLEQLTRGLQLRDALAPKLDYARVAARLVDVPQGPRLPRPAPTPPVEARPKKLSVTEIETWLRDPYAIYAKHVLGLKPLDAIDEPIGPLERGNALHRALEIFIAQYKGGLPDDAHTRLTAIADQVFEDAGIPKAALALWRPRFAAAARGFVEAERDRRNKIKDSHLEIRGKLAVGDFTLTGIADRIDILNNGTAAILDYKTGAVPSAKQVTQLLSPQLPLEGAMLAADGFDIGAHIAEQLIYLSLASEQKARKPQAIEGAAELAQEAVAQLSRRIAWFKETATALPSARAPLSHRHLRRLRPSGAGARMVALRLERGVMREPSVIASDPDISAWVAANAGAGKTYTLANRVARLLLSDAEPQKILCLTFTKAAAAEMQDRLFKQLGEWSMLPDEALRDQIIKIGGDAHADLAKARRLFAAALETPGGLKILTLHAFCQIVLSRFPIETGIPPAFDVLDDQSARELIGEARQHVLERAGSGDSMLQQAVALLVTETSEASLTNILQAALGSDRRKLDRFFDSAEDLQSRLRAPHGLQAGETMASIVETFCESLRQDLDLLFALPHWLAQGTDKDKDSGNQWRDYLGTDFSPDGFGILQRLLLTKEGTPRQKLATKKLTDARPDLLAYLVKLQERYCATAERHRAARAAELAQAALTIVRAMREYYQTAKRLRGVLDYDDLIVETRNLLKRRGAAGWVLPTKLRTAASTMC